MAQPEFWFTTLKRLGLVFVFCGPFAQLQVASKIPACAWIAKQWVHALGAEGFLLLAPSAIGLLWLVIGAHYKRYLRHNQLEGVVAYNPYWLWIVNFVVLSIVTLAVLCVLSEGPGPEFVECRIYWGP